jgi:hypothetical protein
MLGLPCLAMPGSACSRIPDGSDGLEFTFPRYWASKARMRCA